jgi:hypothetical protein
MDLTERAVGDIYYVRLLQHAGCTAYAHETAAMVGGDDIAVRAGGAKVDFAYPRDALPFLLHGFRHDCTGFAGTTGVEPKSAQTAWAM